MPHDEMLDILRRDYEAMAGMIFGSIPSIDETLASIQEFEQSLNRVSRTRSTLG
jgi:hypothetical protein